MTQTVELKDYERAIAKGITLAHHLYDAEKRLEEAEQRIGALVAENMQTLRLAVELRVECDDALAALERARELGVVYEQQVALLTAPWQRGGPPAITTAK